VEVGRPQAGEAEERAGGDVLGVERLPLVSVGLDGLVSDPLCGIHVVAGVLR